VQTFETELESMRVKVEEDESRRRT